VSERSLVLVLIGLVVVLALTLVVGWLAVRTPAAQPVPVPSVSAA
jgi:hypothetical protein